MANYKLLSLLSIILIALISAKNPPTVIDFYMEALCPYCVQFTTGAVKNFLAQTGNEELAIINFVPYGNAKESQKDGSFVFTCQHGDKECRGNLIETCAIKVFDYSEANNFIVCLESNYKGDFDQTAAKCLDEAKLAELQNCLNSEESSVFQHEMAEKTNSLQPPHQWVPWVVVDGQQDDKITEADDLVAYLCSKRSDSSEIGLCQQTIYSEIELRFLGDKLVCRRN